MIRLENITKGYGRQKVLENFSLELAENDRVAVMGRSGKGKTTLIRLLLGLIKADSGRISVPKDTSFGVIFQEDRLIEHLSAVGNVSVVQKVSPAQEEVLELLSGVGLHRDLIYKPVSQLSGGERRRVCIARALAAKADVYIFDEAFKGIDNETLGGVIQTVSRLTEGKMFLLITHDEGEAKMLCNRVVNI